MAYELNEKCAVAGVISRRADMPVAPLVYESLFAMQHRGTEASGIASATSGSITYHRALGMVVDVYNAEAMSRLSGPVAIGHNRYSTSGAKDAHAQPVIDEPIDLAVSVNGNLPSTQLLEAFLHGHGIRTERRNDVEMMGLAIGQYIRQGASLPDAIALAYPLFTGAFSAVAMHDGQLVAFRDAYGIRPLALGEWDHGYAVASETCGLDIIDARYVREVAPGELLIITADRLESRQLVPGTRKLDMFELVYFARHDSQLYGLRVHEVRRRFGEQLAREHQFPGLNPAQVLVVPVPDTSVPASEGYADALGLHHAQALIKNRYIGRTFMQPAQGSRHHQLRRKHNIIPELVKGRDIILIDDSIVRLNTMPRLVELVLGAGATSVRVLIASPPVRFPDFYGIDTPTQAELAAATYTIEQMRQVLSGGGVCDYLGFLSLDGMLAATSLSADMFNLSCFTGEYPIDIGAHKAEIRQPVSMEGVHKLPVPHVRRPKPHAAPAAR